MPLLQLTAFHMFKATAPVRLGGWEGGGGVGWGGGRGVAGSMDTDDFVHILAIFLWPAVVI